MQFKYCITHIYTKTLSISKFVPKSTNAPNMESFTIASVGKYYITIYYIYYIALLTATNSVNMSPIFEKKPSQ